MVLRQGLTGQQLQQVLRLGTTKQFGPSPLGFQLGQEKSRESILFRLREFRRLAEGPLQKLVHPHPSRYQSSRSPGDRRDRNPTKYGRTSRSNNRTLHERRQQSWLLHDGSVTPLERHKPRHTLALRARGRDDTDVAGEKVIQGFLAAFLSLADYYVFRSEAELGKGHADIALEPLIARYPHLRRGYLIELKYLMRSEPVRRGERWRRRSSGAIWRRSGWRGSSRGCASLD